MECIISDERCGTFSVSGHKIYLWQQLVPRMICTGLQFFIKHRTLKSTLHDQSMLWSRLSDWEGTDLTLGLELHSSRTVGLFCSLMYPRCLHSAWHIAGTQLVIVRGSDSTVMLTQLCIGGYFWGGRITQLETKIPGFYPKYITTYFLVGKGIFLKIGMIYYQFQRLARIQCINSW